MENTQMTTPDYDIDFYAWTQAQATALRAKEAKTLDWEHLAEEIESLGNEQRHAARSHLRVLLWHLLKWAYQPNHRSPSWLTSIGNARAEIADRLEDQPSLRPLVPTLLASAYPRARRLAAAKTDLPLATFPEVCPWPIERVLDDDFWPGDTP
jgi:integrase